MILSFAKPLTNHIVGQHIKLELFVSSNLSLLWAAMETALYGAHHTIILTLSRSYTLFYVRWAPAADNDQ